MPSLFPGFEYDIFISYRQKDNKHNGWVTEFVNQLKGELESTFKEDISVYFDINPHDGILEMHDVDASLKDKLKCLVFIPIISRTYCDPNSFAWEHEFKAFVEQASHDRFGLKIKLPGGNVAGRVLPIRIHDLDDDDNKVCETLLGGILRSIEFIYRSPGVNRPLQSQEDHPHDNLNKTFYRDQINKVANAIKEIILGLKSELATPVKANVSQKLPLGEFEKADGRRKQEPPAKLYDRKRIKVMTFSVILFAILAITFYPGLFHTEKSKVVKDSEGRISIAVNTFTNLSKDTLLDSWRMGISELIIYNLGTSKELSVQNSQTMFEVYQSMGHAHSASILPSISRKAAKKLNAGAYITGNIQKAGNKIRIIANLNDTYSDELLWSGKVDGNVNADYIDLADSLSLQLKSYLEIKVLKEDVKIDFRDAFTYSSEAYRLYINGMRSFLNGDYRVAINVLKEAYRIDSSFALAAFYIANANSNIATYSSNKIYGLQAVEWTKKAYQIKNRLADGYKRWVEMWMAYYVTKNTKEVLDYCRLLENSDIKSRYYWYDLAVTYSSNFKMYDKANQLFKKIEGINSEWDDDWKYPDYFINYGRSLFETGNYDEALKVFGKGLTYFPDNGYLMDGQIRCTLRSGDTARATELTKRLQGLMKQYGVSSAIIEGWRGDLDTIAGSFDEAEVHFRRALQYEPNNYWMINNLAFFLIRYNRDINEGMSLIARALEIEPGEPFLLYSKAEGYYKQGRYREALDILLQARENSVGILTPIDRKIVKVREAMSRQ